MQPPPIGWFPTAPPLSFVTITNDRPPGPAAASIPLTYTMRSDFATPFATAMNTVHTTAGQPAFVPFVTPPRTLPVDNPPLPADYDMLSPLGRSLDIVPAVGLVDANVDAVAFAIPNPAAPGDVTDVAAACRRDGP